jgi:hypothetical protein
MKKSILNWVLFSGGRLDGLYLPIVESQRIIWCIEVCSEVEIKHIYEKQENGFHYKGTY